MVKYEVRVICHNDKDNSKIIHCFNDIGVEPLVDIWEILLEYTETHNWIEYINSDFVTNHGTRKHRTDCTADSTTDCTSCK